MMRYYDELNKLYTEKTASPELQFAVRDHKRYRDTLNEKFMLNDIGNPRDGVLKKVYDKQNKKIDKQRRKGAYDKYQYGNVPPQMPTSHPIKSKTQVSPQPKTTPPLLPLDFDNPEYPASLVTSAPASHPIKSRTQVSPQPKVTPPAHTPTSLIESKAQVSPQHKVTPPTQKDPNFAVAKHVNPTDAAAAKAARATRIQNEIRTNNKSKAIGYGITAAGIGAAAYGIHKMRQLKKQKSEEQNQQASYAQQPMMYRTASLTLEKAFLEKIAANEVHDAAAEIPREVRDDASMIEKIQEAIKYSKKEEVPGGKSAPSKLVQRKNKERFMS